ncbi:Cyclic nucleotide-binding domain protein [Maioricimonas rarisocia]|uniref:Cyclic nucleotide-binding domain protein n=1 Tax=Maioricimonas rarisocia TaxID=2528026 RepID=A0A517Z5G9_9PLAN|nr:cyclic nucleotide-binding domain-containing protein [Maioricimonas rarisocia]QDU37726.1 Cyclic nucleotide-binding domain protein [Maioricimonas rarisocia]
MSDAPAEDHLIRFLSTPGLPPKVLKQVAGLGELVEIAAGATVFEEGAEYNRLSIVVSGHIELKMNAASCGDVRILTIGAGDVLGWSPLLGGHRMTATATALEPSQLLSFETGRLRSLFETDFETGYYFMNHISLALMQRLVATRLQLLAMVGDAGSASAGDGTA